MEILVQAFFLSFLALSLGIQLFLNLLNARSVASHREIPAPLSGFVDREGQAKSRRYTLDRLRFGSLSLLYSAAVILLLLFSGVLPWLNSLLEGHLPGRLTQGVVFLALLGLFQSLLGLPFSIYETFVIEGRYGFNTQTWRDYLADLTKEFLLFLLLGVPFLYAWLWFMESAGAYWWLWLFVFIVLFQVFLLVVYPVWIAPLFNKFKPLPEGDLKAELKGLSERLRFPMQDLYVMDGSRRSLHSNAYFTGFGRMRRIVLFDTLLDQMNKDEIKSVLAHEIGHYKLGHVYRSLLMGFLSLAASLFLLAWIIDWPPLYRAFGFSEPVRYVGLFLLFAIFSTVGFIFAPLRNFLSRRHEYQADAFAVHAVGSGQSMESALIKLSRKNLANLNPHPWYSFFHYSHPALLERIAALRQAPHTA